MLRELLRGALGCEDHGYTSVTNRRCCGRSVPRLPLEAMYGTQPTAALAAIGPQALVQSLGSSGSAAIPMLRSGGTVDCLRVSDAAGRGRASIRRWGLEGFVAVVGLDLVDPPLACANELDHLGADHLSSPERADG